VVGDPPLHIAQRLAVGQLTGKLGAELGLVSRAAQEHHQVPGDVQGGVPAEVVFHQGEREVDPGGDAGRGGDVAVPDEDRLLLDIDPRVPLGERGAAGPVGGHPPSVEQSGPSEQEGARAHRDQPLRLAAARPQPAGQFGVGAARSLSAGHDEQVRSGNPELAQVLVGRDAQAARHPHRAAAEAGGADVVSGRVAALLLVLMCSR